MKTKIVVKVLDKYGRCYSSFEFENMRQLAGFVQNYRLLEGDSMVISEEKE